MKIIFYSFTPSEMPMNGSNIEIPQLNSLAARQDRLRKYIGAGAGAAVLAGTVTTATSDIVFINYNNQVYTDTTLNDATSTLFPFDINNDGTTDFRLRQRIDSNFRAAGIRNPVGGTVDVIGQSSTSGTSVFNYPSRLLAGMTIGPGASFLTLSDANSSGSMAVNAGFPGSRWVSTNGATGFLGLRFTYGGQPHYAWVNLTVAGTNDAAPYHFTVHGIAYDTTPNTPIVAGAIPEPSTLGLLALGAVGLAAYRRRKAAESAAQ